MSTRCAAAKFFHPGVKCFFTHGSKSSQGSSPHPLSLPMGVDQKNFSRVGSSPPSPPPCPGMAIINYLMYFVKLLISSTNLEFSRREKLFFLKKQKLSISVCCHPSCQNFAVQFLIILKLLKLFQTIFMIEKPQDPNPRLIKMFIFCRIVIKPL